ncbi:Transcriptional regulator of nonfermentable carbon utilization, partial [Cryomyces antarcticus]
MSERQEQRAAGDEKSPIDASNGNGQKSSSNAKDPLRPRRKKARRACLACQRAHLTCGDERPCQRCVKRGLQDSCHDGMRKKAKYLHDAPNEVLIPLVGGNYHHHLEGSQVPPHVGSASQSNAGPSLLQSSRLYTPGQPGIYPAYPPSSVQGQTQPPLQDNPTMNPFGNQQQPISPPQFSGTSGQQASPILSMTVALPQMSPSTAQQSPQFGGPLFDPSDPAIFNFDIASLNFGNHYGALEFGMLGHMSSGAVGTPEVDNMINSINQVQPGASSFNAPVTTAPAYNESPSSYMFSQEAGAFPSWQNNQGAGMRQGSASQLYDQQLADLNVSAGQDGHNGLPHAYAIGAGPSSLPSASPNPNEVVTGYEGAPLSPAFFVNAGHQQQQQQ